MRLRRNQLVLFAPAAVLLTGWLVLPAVLGLFATFTTYARLGAIVRFSGLYNYAAVLRDSEFRAAVSNIAVFTIVAVPLEVGIGFALAYLLRRPIRGRGIWQVLLLVPWLVSPIANGVMWHFLFGSATGVIDFVLGWLGRPEIPSPIGNARLALPTTIAVEVWRIAPFVTFLLLPLLLAITMLLIGLSLGTFDGVLILTGGGPGTSTVTPALYSYRRAFGVNDWPTGAASAWLIAAGVFGVGVVYMRVVRTRQSARAGCRTSAGATLPPGQSC